MSCYRFLSLLPIVARRSYQQPRLDENGPLQARRSRGAAVDNSVPGITIHRGLIPESQRTRKPARHTHETRSSLDPSLTMHILSHSTRYFANCRQYLRSPMQTEPMKVFRKALALTKRLITSNLLSDRLRPIGETKFPSAMGRTKLWHGVERQGGTDLTPS